MNLDFTKEIDFRHVPDDVKARITPEQWDIYDTHEALRLHAWIQGKLDKRPTPWWTVQDWYEAAGDTMNYYTQLMRTRDRIHPNTFLGSALDWEALQQLRSQQ